MTLSTPLTYFNSEIVFSSFFGTLTGLRLVSNLENTQENNAIQAPLSYTSYPLSVWINRQDYDEFGGMMVATAGVCVMRNLDLGPSSGISMLEFEPSDVILEKERNIIIVASLDEIIALPAGLPTDKASIDSPIQILHQFPRGTEDLEGLEIIDRRVYAVSEGKANSESDIIAFDWTTNNTLVEWNRWRITAPNAVSSENYLVQLYVQPLNNSKAYVFSFVC